ncbi:TetR/AcrR family transcriptional regulator [Bacillus spongiae]|uniref:TetR/AcrR family transcriptional regulator n=1 Tax=Bacillus spongiae TaxID=2683610 RepID=A0ABU8HGM9_9BACI
MDLKEKKIIETALSFFSEKGYYATSVQEIAEECNISKGSLYKYFPSKEDLFIGVCTFFQNELFEKATFVHMEDSSSSTEWLTKQLTLQMEDFIAKREFFILQLKEIPFKDNYKLNSLRQQMKSRIMKWQRDILLKAYGNAVKPFVWDLVVMLQGMMKEYLMLLAVSQQEKPVEEIATFLVQRLDALVLDLKSRPNQVLITNRELIPIFGDHSDIKQSEETISSLIQSIKESIMISESKVEDPFLSSVLLLEEEWKNSKPRKFLMEALLSYIEESSSDSSLTFYVQKAKWLLEEKKGEENSWNI